MKNKTNSGNQPEGNIELVISNQSSDIDPVDIGIRIDGTMILQKEFSTRGYQPAGHNWKRFRIRLDDGPHKLLVTSAIGQTQIEKTLQVNTALSVTIAFWSSGSSSGRTPPGFFTIESGENKVATM